jgi:hypothetical protein
MARLSNAQGLLFAEISTEEIALQAQPVATLKGWFGAQQVGQIKSLVTNTVNEQKGVVTHTVGDSILSSFADASAALAAALGIQRRVAKAQNPATGMIVKVRIGLAYGPVRVFAGKVSGDTVTAAGILLEKAQPNEILADQAMLDAVGSAKETRFEACGVVEGVTAYRVVSLIPVARPSAEGDTLGGGATMPGLPFRKPAAETEIANSPGAPKESSAAAITLTFGGAEKRFTPADGEIFIGRGKDVHVTVPEIHVSRKHAKIVWEEGGIPYLVNLSQNGTCVRYGSTGREHTCMARIPLQGGGDIALCSRFGQVSSQAEIIAFNLLAK